MAKGIPTSNSEVEGDEQDVINARNIKVPGNVCLDFILQIHLKKETNIVNAYEELKNAKGTFRDLF